MVSTDYKRLFLRGLKWDSEDQGLSLFAVLKSAARGRISDTKAGRFIVSSSGNGRATTFAIPTTAGITQVEVAELCEELLRRYDEAVAALELETPEESDNSQDGDIFAEMLDKIQPVNEIASDYSGVCQ